MASATTFNDPSAASSQRGRSGVVPRAPRSVLPMAEPVWTPSCRCFSDDIRGHITIACPLLPEEPSRSTRAESRSKVVPNSRWCQAGPSPGNRRTRSMARACRCVEECRQTGSEPSIYCRSLGDCGRRGHPDSRTIRVGGITVIGGGSPPSIMVRRCAAATRPILSMLASTVVSGGRAPMAIACQLS